MDIDNLLHRHRISLMRAHAGASDEARVARRGLVRGDGARIAAMREAMDAGTSTAGRVG